MRGGSAKREWSGFSEGSERPEARRIIKITRVTAAENTYLRKSITGNPMTKQYIRSRVNRRIINILTYIF